MKARAKALVVTLSTFLAALLLVGGVLDKNANPEAAYKHLRVYTEVLSRIKSDYVEEPDLKNVTMGAINGLLQSVDPFASYLNAEQYREYLQQKDAHKGDVGLILSWKYGYLGVVDAIPGTPADKAGLTTGDMLETIQGISTRDMPLAYAELLLRGKPGTTVNLSVLSIRNPEPKTITLTRTIVEYPPVRYEMLPDAIGHIRVESLAPGRVAEVAAAVKTLESQGAKRFILDLRHCASGPPEEGVGLANLFLRRGLIGYVHGQRWQRQDFQADPSKTISDLPLVVITNRGTAGGAEVAAAALLENKRAEVVGEPTYGNAAIRKPITMDDGAAIILAVAKFYSPAGKAIQDVKVTPTVQVIESEPIVESEEEQPAPAPEQTPPEEDRLLKKAIDVLTRGIPQEPKSVARVASPEQKRPAPLPTPNH